MKRSKTVVKVVSKAKPVIVAKKTVRVKAKPRTTIKLNTIAASNAKQAKVACFTAGTKIHTEKGFKHIEKIKAGDYVWSENPETKEKALKQVKKIFVREKDSIVRLAINGEVIETTSEHPFYVEGKGWIAAGELTAGTEVRLEDGSSGTVTEKEDIQLEEPVTVYNFEVEDYHTYYVSEQKVLVHNMCAMTAKNTAASTTVDKTVARSASNDPKFEIWLNKGEANYSVYHGMVGNEAKYVGITKQDLELRRMQHKYAKSNPKIFDDLKQKHQGLTRNQARALEQYYIEMRGGPNELNLINSISPKHRFAKQAEAWAKNYLGVE